VLWLLVWNHINVPVFKVLLCLVFRLTAPQRNLKSILQNVMKCNICLCRPFTDYMYITAVYL